MKGKTAKEILTEVLTVKGAHKSMGVDVMKLQQWKKRLRDGTMREETMEKLLKMEGYKVVQERLWAKD